MDANERARLTRFAWRVACYSSVAPEKVSLVLSWLGARFYNVARKGRVAAGRRLDAAGGVK